jgi:DNA-binding transcriptional LysR family regulator
MQPLTAEADYRAHRPNGQVDVVIGNWSAPPGDLHLARLIGDEVVCLVAKDHPAVRKKWSAADPASWLEAELIAPSATHPGFKGVIDKQLASLGLVRNITVR